MNTLPWINRFFSLVLFFFTVYLTDLPATPSEYTKYGLAKISEEQQAFLESSVDKVIEIAPNDLGIERIQKHLQKHGLPPLEGVETTTHEFKASKVSSKVAKETFKAIGTLPSAVNNSTLPCFPNIGDQGSLGACVGFGSTYYQATHEIGLINGYNNKTSLDHVFSPKWTYNLLNDGQDQGLSVFEAFQLLAINGTPSILAFPYDSNYTAWELDTTDWVNAISNRMNPYVLIPGLDGDLTAIKQALNNGHVLTFATFINSWHYTTIKNDPDNINNAHVGEVAATYMSGQNGGHFMTIVGYDDTLWVDINNNGVVDDNERGAFLIANSWGTSWGNNGFIWISYDAFRSISAVSGGPSLGRIALGAYLNSSVISITPKAKNYSPTLIAEMSLTQTQRNQINVKTGISATNQTSPTSSVAIPALTNQGGALNFSGTTSSAAQTMTFAVDLSDLAQLANQRYYLSIGDNKISNPTTLNSYKLLDFIHNTQAEGSGLPKTYDNSVGSVFIDYDLQTGATPSPTPAPAPTPSPTPPPPPPPSPSSTIGITITQPINNAIVKGKYTIKTSTQGKVTSVSFYLDNVLVSKDTKAPFTAKINTAALSNGTHQIKAVATNGSQTATAAQNIQIQNSNKKAPFPPSKANSSNPESAPNLLVKEPTFWTGTSTTSQNSFPFINPIYNTDRVGNMAFKYPTSNGQYFVKLCFAETEYQTAGKRIFNVLLNNKKIINNLDIFTKVGANSPYEVIFIADVQDEFLLIEFTPVIGTAKINGIEIIPR